ncbi:MAG: hypothetical protein ACRDT8_00805, partial [Micromonosporaceae bacterium]
MRQLLQGFKVMVAKGRFRLGVGGCLAGARPTARPRSVRLTGRTRLAWLVGVVRVIGLIGLVLIRVARGRDLTD